MGGQFTEISYQAGVAVNQDGNYQANMAVALGDYAYSGHFSIAITHFSDEYAASFRKDGEMSFSDVSYSCGIAPSTTQYVGWGNAFFDFDNDGCPDFFIVDRHIHPQVDSANIGTRYWEPKLLFLNKRNGTFPNISKLVGPAIQILRVSRGIAVGDLFNDGRLEIVIENLRELPMILRPEGGPQNHWISIELQGTTNNRLALNASAEAVARDLVQTGTVLSSGSYLFQNDLKIHFGLDSHDHLDKLEILWPNCRPETITGLSADRFYSIEEGNGVVASEKIRPRKPASSSL
jgi:enediyne biosynthesis protein E4